MKEYFEYMIYLAFYVILSYENKRQLTIEEIHNYRITLSNKVYDNCPIPDNEESMEEQLADFLGWHLKLNDEEEKSLLTLFIEKNSGLFILSSSGIISLKPEVTLEQIREKISSMGSFDEQDDVNIPNELLFNKDCPECLRVLEITLLPNEVEKISTIEQAIECAYQAYQTIDSQNQIRIGNLYIDVQMLLISKMDVPEIEQYKRLIDSIDTNQAVEADEFSLLSDELRENDGFYKANDYIDLMLSNKYQRAIFDNSALTYIQLSEYIMLLLMYKEQNKPPSETDGEEEYDDIEDFENDDLDPVVEYEDEFDDEVYENVDEEDKTAIEECQQMGKVNFAFYLKYIKTLIDYQQQHGMQEVLETAKKRLLYTLNSRRRHLYDEENFQLELSKISIDDFDYREDFFDFYVISRLFLIDILDNGFLDEYTLRKLLFVQTYYDFTKDNRIIKIMEKFRNSEIAKQVRAVVLEHQPYDEASSNRLKRTLEKNNK